MTPQQSEADAAAERPPGRSDPSRPSKPWGRDDPALQAEVVANMAEGVCLVRVSDSTILHTNPRFDELLGYEPGELEGRHVSVVNAPSGGEPRVVAAEIQQALADHGTWSGEVLNVRKDGAEIWCQVNVSNLEHPEYGLVSVAVHSDVTERREMVAALRRERASLARAQAIARMGSWELDLRTGELLWSDQMYEVTGRDPALGPPSPEEFLSEIAHPDDRERIQRLTDELQRNPRRAVDECRVRHADGSWRRMVVEFASIEPDGARSAGTLRDVTEERAAQDALYVAQERFSRSFEGSQVGMAIIAPDDRFQEINAAFCAIVGYSRDELVGRMHASIVHPEDVRGELQARRAMLAGRDALHIEEKRFINALGDVVWVRTCVTLIRDADGHPLHFVAHVQDITELRKYEARLQFVADHDSLTGLLNRRGLEREVRSQRARASRYGASGGVLMIDLDHFKYVNDTQGHAAGDAMLVRVAHALRARLRESDVVARLGGDEFAVLLAAGDTAETEAVAATLLEVVRDAALPAPGDMAPAPTTAARPMTASIGIARFDGRDVVTAEEIMADADLAMYEAKDAGGDRWSRYRPERHTRPRKASHSERAAEINHAIANERFELVAQPIASLGQADESTRMFEVLLRMRDRHGNLILPGSFLPTAERLGQIVEIDRWVVGAAIDLLAEHRRLGRDPRLAVNISGRTIGDEHLLEFIEHRLCVADVPPDRLIFELTETATVADVDRASAFARRLAALGCLFALDDFGAGFGSFYYLKYVPFDYLKIDGEFVARCAHNATDRILISAVVQIARGMGKRTIGEFVADQETLHVLTELGVDYGQGYHTGRPAPLSEHLAGARNESSPAPDPGAPPPG